MTNMIGFEPYFSPFIIGIFAFFAILLIIITAFFSRKSALLKSLPFLGLCVILLNPVLLKENRENLSDIILVIRDQTESMKLENRDQIADQIQASLKAFSKTDPSLDIVEYDLKNTEDGSKLLPSLQTGLAKIPTERLSAILLLTDGQIHDSPSQIEQTSLPAPIYPVIIGSQSRPDRRIEVFSAPRYGIIHEKTEFTFQITDHALPQNNPLNTKRKKHISANHSKQALTSQKPIELDFSEIDLEVKINGQLQSVYKVRKNQKQTLSFQLEHRGKHLVELRVPALENELTLLNNQYHFEVEGIRDRLRVLLITGSPYSGARQWRNLLKSDPSIDLVHFTILRPPFKDPMASEKELALIPFPTHQLFYKELQNFDLLIFDRYRLRGALLPYYIENINRYVENGGGLLVTTGPDFAGSFSLYRSPLARILPASPTGKILEKAYQPSYTEFGLKHPITAFANPDHTPPKWGRWLRLIEANRISGHVLLTDQNANPLLLIDRIEKGRIALLLSDHAWFWAKGIDGGGPYTELFKRLAHWLMKEPELEENRLDITPYKDEFILTQSSFETNPEFVELYSPDQHKQTLKWELQENGKYQTHFKPDQTGVWKAVSNGKTRLFSVGSPNPKELETPRSTSKNLAPLSKHNQVRFYFVQTEKTKQDGNAYFNWKRVHKNNLNVQADIIGLKKNQAYKIIDRTSQPLTPIFILACLLLFLIAISWYYES